MKHRRRWNAHWLAKSVVIQHKENDYMMWKTGMAEFKMLYFYNLDYYLMRTYQPCYNKVFFRSGAHVNVVRAAGATEVKAKDGRAHLTTHTHALLWPLLLTDNRPGGLGVLSVRGKLAAQTPSRHINIKHWGWYIPGQCPIVVCMFVYLCERVCVCVASERGC